MNPLLEQFVIESRDFLERIANGLLTLERDPDNSEAIDELFRGVHTLKGNSGLFPEYAAFTHLVHAGEDLLDSVRSGECAFTPVIADRLLECMDIVSGMLNNIEAGEDLDAGLCEQGEALAVVLRALRTQAPSAPTVASLAADDPPGRTAVAAAEDALANDAETAEHDSVASAADIVVPDGGWIHVCYTPEAGCFFKGDDPLYLALGAPGLEQIRVSQVEPWPPLDTLDPYACNLRIDAWCDADAAELEAHFRYVPDQVVFDRAGCQQAAVEPDTVAVGTADTGVTGALHALAANGNEASGDREDVSEEDQSAVSAILRAQYEALARAEGPGRNGVWQSVARVLGHLAPLRGVAAERVSEALVISQSGDSGDALAHLLDQMTHGTQPPRPTRDTEPAPLKPSARAAASASRLSEEELSLVERVLDAQRQLLAANASVACLQSVGNALLAMRRYEGGALAPVEAAVGQAVANGDYQTLLQVIETWHSADAPASASVAASFANGRSTTPAVAANDALPATLKPATATPVRPQRPADTASAPAIEIPSHEHAANRVLKVSQEKIDRLMDLIGEMVVAKNALPYLAARAEASTNPREIAREIKNQYGVINRIAEEMQDAIMQVRMLPVGNILQRFPRLVRDISRKLGKQVDLQIEGEDAEADKNVIESLADPLIHIVRNSLDHGLELPDERRAAGKPETGVISICAFQEADRAIIEISDDGRGIDPQRIKAKALERGLIDEARATSMTDHEAVQLVFAAGFSTAEQISDLSGRGVGMDVVRSAIEKAHGQVELSSELGRGTRIRIALPLSMAVTNVMIIRSAEQMFGVQMDMVVETVRVPQTAIHQIKQQRTTVLRGRIVPLYGLNDLLGIGKPPAANDEGEVAVLVIRLGGQDVGVIVDDFDATLDLILKPLDGPLGELAGYAGTALLGDGSVLMVLNLKELL